MSLKLATVEELRTEADEVVGGLRGAGRPATVESSPESDWTVSRIQESIRGGSIDLGLVPCRAPVDGVERAAVLRREEPRDVLVSAASGGWTLARIRSGTTIGLVGARRLGLLRAHRPDLRPLSLTNGHTPASVLRAGNVGALIVGSAQARRLGLSELTKESLDPKSWMPEPGQGTLVLLARADDPSTRSAASLFDDQPSRRTWLCETALAQALGAGSDAPLGALALPFGRWIRLWAMATSLDGSRVVRADLTGSAEDPEGLGRAVADLLLMRGVGTLLGGETS